MSVKIISAYSRLHTQIDQELWTEYFESLVLVEAVFLDTGIRQSPQPRLRTGRDIYSNCDKIKDRRKTYLDWVVADLIFDALDNLVHPFPKEIFYIDTIKSEITKIYGVVMNTNDSPRQGQITPVNSYYRIRKLAIA